MNAQNNWNSDLYDNKLGFVAGYGKDVMELLKPQPGERILDLGCGTGTLTHEIAKAGAEVTGIDLSEAMLQQARSNYPQLAFIHADAGNFQLNEKFDAVFSNAALHWMKHAEQVVSCIWEALKERGRFVTEFGGLGNIARVEKAIQDVLQESCGIDASARNPWYFPSIGQYSSILENLGFTVTYAHLFDRPTKQADGEAGLRYWLDGFAAFFFEGLSADEKHEAYEQIKSRLRSDLFIDGSWYVDYKRIRIIAEKG